MLAPRYAPLDKPSLLVHEMTITVGQGQGPVLVSLASHAGTTHDLNMSAPVQTGTTISWTGAKQGTCLVASGRGGREGGGGEEGVDDGR